MPLGPTLFRALALAAVTRCAQAQPPLPPPAKVITLNVVARDQHDQPVADLGVDDFKVFDQGKLQPIAFFRRYQDPPKLAIPLGPREYSNRTAPAPHGVVILLDLLNTSFSNRGYGADEVAHTLAPLEASDYLYAYILTATGSLYPLHALPTPGSEVNPSTVPWTKQIDPIMKDAMREVSRFKPIDEQQIAIRVSTTYRALQSLAAAMAALPGRKDVIWITQGVPRLVPSLTDQPYDFMPELQRLGTALNRAGVTLNPVDQGEAVGTGRKETLDEFASLTGGRSYPPRSLEKALPEVLANPRTSYQIEYAALPPDGKLHKIRLTAARKGVRLQGPQDYINTTLGVSDIPSYKEVAFTTPLDASEIGLRATATPAGRSVHLEIRVDPRDLMHQPKGVPLSIVVISYTPKGPEATAETTNVTLKDKPPQEEIVIAKDVDATAIQRVRIIVVDGGSNAIGSLTIPLSAR